MEAVEPRRPYKRPTTPRSFHPGEGKVLRFYGRWVDEQGPSKEFRKFVVGSYKLLAVFCKNGMNRNHRC